MKLRLPLILLSALISSFTLSSAPAATVTWNAASGTWSTASGWGGTLPTSTDDAVIGAATTLTVDGSYTVAKFSIDGGNTVKNIIGTDSSSKVTYTGDFELRGGVSSNITLGDGITPLNISSASTTTTSDRISVINVIVTIKENATISGARFITANASGAKSIVNLDGGTINVTGTSSSVDTTSSAVLLGHWSGSSKSNFNMTAGVFNAKYGIVVGCWDGPSYFDMSGGTANFKGINLNDTKGHETIFTLTGGRLNIGSLGIAAGTNVIKKILLSNTTIGAFDNWSANHNMSLESGDTTFNTLDSEDNSTARTITVTGALSGAGNLVKDGTGTLILQGTNSYTGSTTAKKGILELTSALTSSSINIYTGATIQGAGTSSFNGSLTVMSNSSSDPAAVWNTAANLTNLTLANVNSKITINGGLNLSGDLTINVNASEYQMGPLINVINSGTLTLSSSSKIVINALNDALDQTITGVVKLTIINPAALGSMSSLPDIVWNRTDEKYVFDTSNFLTSGQVSWTSSGNTYSLLTQAEANSVPFAPADENVYVGANEAHVVFSASNTYTPYDGNTRLTDGRGIFVFQPSIASSGALFVTHMTGGTSVVITNNANAQTRTEVTNTRLVVDSTQGTSPIAAGTATNILGTGAVNIYGSTASPGTVELRVGGDTASAGEYTLANTFRLDGNAHILQSGANSHKLTGTITINPGSNTSIRNTSSQDLVIAASIQAGSNSSVVFAADNGNITLSGQNSLTIPSLNISGNHGLTVKDGYTINATAINLNASSSLALQNKAILNLGSGGITEGNSIELTNSTINFQDNASIKTPITSSGSVTINTKANKKGILEKGLGGTADLVKTGAGKLVIATANDPSTTGTITLKEGSLQLGQDTSIFLEDEKTPIAAVYTLKGDLNVESGTLSGMIDAGNNNVHFGSSSIFTLGMDSENLSSRITNANNITVDQGATILVDVLGQGWTTDTDYYIISANASISGSPFILKADGNFAFVEVNLKQTDKNVILTLSPKIPDIALDTRNEAAIFPTISTLVTDALEGRYGSLNKELLKEMQYVSKMTVGQLDEYVTTTALSAASLYSAISGQVANTTRHVQGLRNHVNRLDPVIFDKYQLTGNRYIWAEGFINYSDVDSTNYAPGYQLDAWGAHTGIAFSLSEKAFFGTGFGYISGETKLKDGFGETESDTFNIDLFGRYKEGNFSLLAVVSGGFSSVDYTRSASLYGDPLNATASADGSQVLGMIEAAYDFQLNESGSSILQPLVNVTAGYVKYDAFDEKGLGNAGYHVDSQQVTMSTLGAGVRYIYTYDTPDARSPYYLEARAMVTQDVGDTSYDIKANYIGSRANVMHLQGVPLERTAFIIGASASIPISRAANLFGDVNSEFRSGQNSISTNVGLSFMF